MKRLSKTLRIDRETLDLSSVADTNQLNPLYQTIEMPMNRMSMPKKNPRGLKLNVQKLLTSRERHSQGNLPKVYAISLEFLLEAL